MEEILKPLLTTICEEYHHDAVKDHTYYPDTCTIHLLPSQSTVKAEMRGDMNHVYKVFVRIECAGGGGVYIKSADIPLVVKCAPEKVLFIQEIAGQEVPLDPAKVQVEHAALSMFYQIQQGSVPKPYGLHLKNRAVVMEDISSYSKLQDQLLRGRVAEHVSAIVGAFQFIGLVHKTTWIQSLPHDQGQQLLKQFNNHSMKRLMAQFLFDRPYNAKDPSNTCNPLLAKEIDSVRKDPVILSQVAQLRTEFLEQLDCLCHGDFACDNIFVAGDLFKVLDLEFASIGLCAYDVALLLETLVFQVLYHSFHDHQEAKGLIHSSILHGLEAYEAQVGSERMTNPEFVRQVSGLIGCEQIWRVLGAAEIDEFEGGAEPERLLLNMGKELLQSDPPTMMELVRFRGRERRINIPQEISTMAKCRQFGYLLLEDSTGARVRNISQVHRDNPEQMNLGILEQWLDGTGKQPVTCKTLIEILYDVELTTPASDIQKVKLHQN